MSLALIGYLAAGVIIVAAIAQAEYRQEQARLRNIAAFRAQRLRERYEHYGHQPARALTTPPPRGGSGVPQFPQGAKG
jgi:CHASE1-domain containing sensor protein